MGTINTGLPAVRAVEVCRYFSLSGDGRKLLQPDITPEQFMDVLVENKLYPDAVQLLGHYLPKRQAVWWALTCVKQGLTEVTPVVEEAFKATEKWIADPSEENRKATLKAADEADASTPAGAAALAAFYSEGLPKTEDPKANARAFFMTAKLASAAVLLAATGRPEELQIMFAAFVEKGREVISKLKR